MKRENLSEILGLLDEGLIAEARVFDPSAGGRSPERIRPMKKKRIVTLALAAALLLSLSIAACAAYNAVGTPQAAEKIALEQIERWKELGLLSPGFALADKAYDIRESPEHVGSDYWFGRIFTHSYNLKFRRDLENDRRCSAFLRVDTMSGRITEASLDARAEAGREPVSEIRGTDENGAEKSWYYYDNYEDIFPADMTVDRFCSLLAQYWGFGGYTIADTDDTEYYHEHWEAVDGSTLLRDLASINPNYYLTVFFDGDQAGVPMYIQLHSFPGGYVNLMLGTNHGIG